MINMVEDFFLKNKMLLLKAVLVFALCFIIGFVAFNLFSDDDQSFLKGYSGEIFDLITGSENNVEPQEISQQFKSVLFKHLVMFFVWWLCGYCMFGTIPAFLLLAYRGFLLGLTFRLLLAWDLAYGIIVCILLLMPAQILLVLTYILATVKSTNTSLNLLSSGESYLATILRDSIFYGGLGFVMLAAVWFQVIGGPKMLGFFINLI